MKTKHYFAPVVGTLLLGGILFLKPESPAPGGPFVVPIEQFREKTIPIVPEEFDAEIEENTVETLPQRIETAFREKNHEEVMLLAQIAAGYGSFDTGLRAFRLLLNAPDFNKERIDYEVESDLDLTDMLTYAVENSRCDREVRTYAVGILGRILDLHELLDLFRERVDREGDPQVHTAMVNSLANLDHPATLPLLEQACRNAPNRTSRKRVFEALDRISAREVTSRLTHLRY